MNYRKFLYGILNFLVSTTDKCKHFFTKFSFRKKAKKWCREKKCSLNKEQTAQAKTFWKAYTCDFKTYHHYMYTAINGHFDVRYMPDDIFYGVIEPRLNQNNPMMVNKSYFPLYFDCKMPEIAFHKMNGLYMDEKYQIIPEEKAIELCLKYASVIFKPSVGSFGGKNIKIVKSTPELLKDAFDCYSDVKSYVVQKVISQHPALSAVHESSVNTIRVITLLINGQVYAMPPVLRMGVNNSIVDNSTSGGIMCGILPDGHLKRCAFSDTGVKYDKHPQGFIFENCIVPSIDKIIDTVKRLAARFPFHRFIAWDMAVGEDGEPLLIEANLNKGGISAVQICHGPLFGDLTDDVLKEVFAKR